MSQQASWTPEELKIFKESLKRFAPDASLSLLMKSQKIADLLDGKSTVNVLEHMKWNYIEKLEKCIAKAKASQPFPIDDLQQNGEDLLDLTLGTGPYRKKRKMSDSHSIKKDLVEMQATLAVLSESLQTRLEEATNDMQRVKLVQKNLLQILRNLV